MSKQNMFSDNVYINTSFELRQVTGIGAYIKTLFCAMDKLGIDYRCVNLELANFVRYTYIWQTLWLNSVVFFKTLIKKPKYFISPAFIMPYFKVKDTKYITVIHDLCHLRGNEMKKYSKAIYKLSVDMALKRADVIVTVSNTVRQELIDTYGLNPNRVKVIYNSIAEHFINAEFKNDILKKYDIQKDNYILSVATLNKRKNIPELIKAFELISVKYPDIKLVLVGGMGNENREILTKHSNIIFTGYIEDEELPTLYKNAMFYVFPSLYEGFGTPNIETQYLGCPLLCSDIPVFREVAGNGAEFCAVTAERFAEKIEFLIKNPKRRKELIQNGYENVKRFSLERISEQLNGIIEYLCK